MIMKQLIDKSAVVAEIEGLKRNTFTNFDEGVNAAAQILLDFLDTLEVKEVEEKFEHPNIEAKDAVEVLSRMPHIDKKLIPIAEFIMDYCSWNLHKDEWNQPVLEVPLFRVLDALVQKGKPYCEG